VHRAVEQQRVADAQHRAGADQTLAVDGDRFRAGPPEAVDDGLHVLGVDDEVVEVARR
jgi:hypothetical protein